MLHQEYPERPSWSAGLPMRWASSFVEHAQVTLTADFASARNRA